jgi:hypothetical protein
MLCRQLQLVALLGQRGQLEVRSVVVRPFADGFLPPRDSLLERPVDIAKRLFGGGVPVLPQPVEDAPRLGLLLALVAQERVLHRHARVPGVQLHGFPELPPRQLVLADLQVGVCQILADRRPLRRRRNGRLEPVDRGLVVLRAQCPISASERLEGRIRSLRQGQAAGREQYCDAHGGCHIVLSAPRSSQESGPPIAACCPSILLTIYKHTIDVVSLWV